jgi:rare lipoprotein A (peptidoglycan hydrolase)
LLFVTLSVSIAAQQREEGWAICYYEGDTGLFATHKSLPFGTPVEVENMGNESKVTVIIGGRPDTDVLIELSQEAAERLKISEYAMTKVKITPIVPAAPPVRHHVMRPRFGLFKQTGAIAVQSGAEFIASHPSLPMQTRVKVTNPVNHKETSVIITNRIPASPKHIIALSEAVVRDLALPKNGEVQIETIDR